MVCRNIKPDLILMYTVFIKCLSILITIISLYCRQMKIVNRGDRQSTKQRK